MDADMELTGDAAYPIDVLVVGGAGVDTIVRVPALPVPLADTVHVPPMHRHAGHSGSGWALGLHALGVRTHLLDLVGADLEAEVLRERFATAALPFTGVEVAEGTKRSVNLVADDGTRMSLHDGRGQRLHPPLAGCHRDLLGRSRHLHVTIDDWTRGALREAVAAGRTVSTDLNDWDGANPYHEEFGYAADLVFVSTVALGEPGAVAALVERLLTAGRARAVVTTSGAAGSTVHSRGGEPIHMAVAPLPGPVRDHNGAGDAYGAAFVAAWLEGADWATCAHWGAVAGAHAVTVAGTNADPIDRARLLARRAGPM
jgi:sugar/nucleoside kinase (ribokinase family)